MDDLDGLGVARGALHGETDELKIELLEFLVGDSAAFYMGTEYAHLL